MSFATGPCHAATDGPVHAVTVATGQHLAAMRKFLWLVRFGAAGSGDANACGRLCAVISDADCRVGATIILGDGIALHRKSRAAHRHRDAVTALDDAAVGGTLWPRGRLAACWQQRSGKAPSARCTADPHPRCIRLCENFGTAGAGGKPQSPVKRPRQPAGRTCWRSARKCDTRFKCGNVFYRKGLGSKMCGAEQAKGGNQGG
jgi:hypothetical protein